MAPLGAGQDPSPCSGPQWLLLQERGNRAGTHHRQLLLCVTWGVKSRSPRHAAVEQSRNFGSPTSPCHTGLPGREHLALISRTLEGARLAAQAAASTHARLGSRSRARVLCSMPWPQRTPGNEPGRCSKRLACCCPCHTPAAGRADPVPWHLGADLCSTGSQVPVENGTFPRLEPGRNGEHVPGNGAEARGSFISAKRRKALASWSLGYGQGCSNKAQGWSGAGERAP